MQPTHPEFAVALLRGINVGGKNRVLMSSLAAIFSAAGCTDVSTFIQSGNVVFRHKDLNGLAEQIGSAAETSLGFKMPVVLRSATELRRAIAQNPYLPLGIDPVHLHIMFLRDIPSPADVSNLDRQRSLPDEFKVLHREIHLHLPNGAARTKFTNAYFDSRLKTTGTQRNWQTVLALARLTGVAV